MWSDDLLEHSLHEEIGRRIRSERTARGMTQSALAARVGCTRENVSYIETGSHGPRLVTLVRICSALGVPIGEIVPSVPLP